MKNRINIKLKNLEIKRINFNKKNLIKNIILNPFILIGMIFISLFLLNINVIFAEDNTQYVSEDIKNDIYQSIDLYYYYFISENLDEYLNTQYLKTLNNKELEQKKHNILELWKRNKYGYMLDDKDNFIYSVNGSIAYVEYNVTNSVLDLNYNDISSNKIQMSAILIKSEDNKWKILNIIPTSVFNQNVEANLLDLKFENSNDDSNNDSNNIENKTENITKTENEKKAINMAKYPPKLYHYNNYCKLNINLTNYNDIDLSNINYIDKLINDNSVIELKIDNIEAYYKYENNHLKLINKTNDFDYYVFANACVVNRILKNNSIAMEEYNKGNIKVTGNNIVNKIKIGIGNFIFSFLSFFNFI